MPEKLAIILMGVSGCGKSTVGAALAKSLACPFIEGDEYHPPANVAKMAAGQPLDDADRAPWLAAVGTAACQALQQHSNTIVVSCSALKPQYRDTLRSQLAPAVVRFVLLEPTEQDLSERVQARQTSHFMHPALLQSQIATLDTSSDPPDLRLGPTPSGTMPPLSDLVNSILHHFSLS